MRRGLALLLPLLVAGACTLPATAAAAAGGAPATTTDATERPLPPEPADPARAVAFRAAVVLAKDATVYVDPTQEQVFDRVKADQIRGKIARVGGSPMYVAVLPGNALGSDGDKQLKELTLRLGYSVKATIAVVTGGRLRAASTAIPYAQAQQFADEAIAANDGEPLEVTIADFIDRVAKEEGRSDSGGVGGVITGVLSTIVVFGGGGILLLRRRRRWRELIALRPLVESDLDELAKEVATVLEPEAATVREPLERALRAYKKARGVEHLPQVARELAAARQALAVARAVLAGEVPPPAGPSCLFDARHGAAPFAVEWTPGPGIATRTVHACALDAQLLKDGLPPAAREVEMAEGQAGPWYEAGPTFRYFLAPGELAALAGLPAGQPLRASRWLP